jgi:hypothetical protein
MTTFRKLDLFPSSGEGKKPTQLGPLEIANLNYWTTLVRYSLCFVNYASEF